MEFPFTQSSATHPSLCSNSISLVRRLLKSQKGGAVRKTTCPIRPCDTGNLGISFLSPPSFSPDSKLRFEAFDLFSSASTDRLCCQLLCSCLLAVSTSQSGSPLNRLTAAYEFPEPYLHPSSPCRHPARRLLIKLLFKHCRKCRGVANQVTNLSAASKTSSKSAEALGKRIS